MTRQTSPRTAKAMFILTVLSASIGLTGLGACGSEVTDAATSGAIRPGTAPRAAAERALVQEGPGASRAPVEPDSASAAAVSRVDELTVVAQGMEELRRRLEALPNSGAAQEILAAHRRRLDDARARAEVEDRAPREGSADAAP